jgi:hypothetical protein
MEELDKRGEFSDAHKAFLNPIRQRSDKLRKRVVEAQQKGTTWELMKTEFERDFSSLFDDLSLWEERLDAEAMKDRKP